MTSMKAAVYEEAGKIVLRNCPIPEIKKGWALIKVDYCGICGTDLNIFAGSHPRAEGPLIIGHEFSGTIVQHPTLEHGTLVTVRPLLFCGECEPCKNGVPHVCKSLRLLGIDQPGGMAEYVLAPVEEIYPLPENMSSRKGALIEPFAVAVHAVRESNFKPGDNVTVFGAGPIGLCTAITLKKFGAQKVTVVEVQPFRKEVAESLGFNVLDPTTLDNEINENEIVFDCAAHPSVAKLLVKSTKIKGQIVLVGTYKFPTELDLQNITFKEISIKGTRVYTEKDYEIAVSLLASKSTEFEKLITQEFTVEEVDAAFKHLSSGRDSVKVMITL
ncbi:zinc-dependent alcohol dehydrogenase [Cytobacillus oceanisediminis]|uniref:zinc-dependent alcohol dehydrogenase n=1 Tax=Cytobacillus oceanisediminis TaxID=665099 RepID=UPI001CCAE70B|nr:alcohol dehydrogenase catalytic domain-containing protein [Cytobacillus oceanisediminis]